MKKRRIVLGWGLGFLWFFACLAEASLFLGALSVNKAKAGVKTGCTTRSFSALVKKEGPSVVEESSPSEEARFKPGDIILEPEQMPVRTVRQLEKKLGTFKPGDTVLFLMSRQGSTRFLTMSIL